ncbi:MAG: hypothetical protein AAFV07_19430, partial [Bacteroidota bacterium]
VETGGVLTVNGESIQLMGRGGAEARTIMASHPTLRVMLSPLSKDEQADLLKRGPKELPGLDKAALKSVWQPAGLHIIPDAVAGTYTWHFTVAGEPDTLFMIVYPDREGPLHASHTRKSPRFTGRFSSSWSSAAWSAGTYWVQIRHGANVMWRKLTFDE